MSRSTTLTQTTELEPLVRAAGFERFGFAELTRPVTLDLYEAWLQKGHQGEMAWLVDHLPLKAEPERLLPKARSAIVVTENYVPHPAQKDDWPLSSNTRVALYARGYDYHWYLKTKLKKLVESLKEKFPEDEFLCFTDSAPVLERDLAVRAGLGWIGKNTCLLSRDNGSLFFIAEIYTTLELPTAKLENKDFCGTCTRCLDACPTGALQSPRELNARLCISYLTIESRSLPEESLRRKMGDWLFGCDICQTVCPWNLKFHGKDKLESLNPASTEEARKDLIQDLTYILTSSNRTLEKAFAGTPLWRSGGVNLKRNALVVVANKRIIELESIVQSFCEHPKLGSLAKWTLDELYRETY